MTRQTADYQVWFIDPANDDVLLFFDQSQIYQLQYERNLNDISVVTVELSADNKDFFELIPFDTIIEVRRIPKGETVAVTENAYVVRTITRTREGLDERFVIGGLSLEWILSGRIIDPDDDPNQAGGYSTKAGAADDVIREYVREQAADLASANRSYPDFSVPATSSIGKGIGRRLRYENLWNQVKEMATAGDVDFEFVRLNDGAGSFEMRIGQVGSDKSFKTTTPLPPYTVLSPNRGNIESPQYRIDKRDEITTVYVLSEGQNTNRKLFVLESGNQNNSVFARREKKIEARQSERTSTEEIFTNALFELNKNLTKREFDFDVIPGAGGAEYRVDFDLGDIITVKWESILTTIRITNITVTIDSNGEKIEVGVSSDSPKD